MARERKQRWRVKARTDPATAAEYARNVREESQRRRDKMKAMVVNGAKEELQIIEDMFFLADNGEAPPEVSASPGSDVD